MSLSNTLATTLAKKYITVNCICPGGEPFRPFKIQHAGLKLMTVCRVVYPSRMTAFGMKVRSQICRETPRGRSAHRISVVRRMRRRSSTVILWAD